MPTVDPVLEPGTLARLDQPVLRAGELVLRPWAQADVASLVRAYSQPDIRRWHARSLDEAEAREWIVSRSEHWRSEIGGDWAVADGGGVVGRVGLREIDLAAGRGEVSYWVLAEARGRGIATRALCAMTDWAFDRLGLHRLELTHATANAVSCRVARAACYAVEGTKRKETLHLDGWHDMHLHARLAADPRPVIGAAR
jgi:ribosomal-protein-alanine N-acetyltransferase